MQTILILFALLPFYFCGVIPIGYLLAKRHKIDLANSGSGNVGATNVTRLLGKRLGAVTLALDAFKGIIAVAIAQLISGDAFFTGAAGVAVVLGHCISIPKKLKGGKGVATALGVLIYFSHFYVVTIVLSIFVLVLKVFKYVSLASLCAVFSAPIISYFFGVREEYVNSLGIIVMIIFIRHKDNLVRLAHGTEKKSSSV